MDTFTKLAAMSALLSTAAALQANQIKKTIYVDASAPTGGDGSSWNRAYKDFAKACDAATSLASTTPAPSSGIVIDIRLAKGIYRPTSDRVSSFAAYQIGKAPTVPLSASVLASGLSLSILGGFAGRSAPNPDVRDLSPYVSVLTADVNGDDLPGFLNRSDNAQTVLAIFGGNSGFSYSIGAFVEGVTFTGGNARSPVQTPIPQSGGLLIGGHNMIGNVQSCWFFENQGIRGGGLGMENGFVLRSEFGRNEARVGGGGAGALLDLFECSIYENRAVTGGGVYTDGILKQCEIRQNFASEDGGGIATGIVTGRGCYAFMSLISENSAGLRGGGVCSFESGLRMYRCTVVNNRAGAGGGIATSAADLRGTVIWNNVGPAVGREIESIGNLYVGSSLLSNSPGAVQLGTAAVFTRDNVLTSNPMFLDEAGPDGNPFTSRDSNYRLSPLSPCIDRAGSTGLSERDLDGLTAHEIGPAGTFAIGDMGCYEWRQSCPADFDNTGGTPDANDLAAFFSAFASGAPSADVNKSGGTPDSNDIQAFFNVWLAGGC